MNSLRKNIFKTLLIIDDTLPFKWVGSEPVCVSQDGIFPPVVPPPVVPPPIVPTCTEYEIFGGVNGRTVSFLNCSGRPQVVNVPPGDSVIVCSSQVIGGATILGACEAVPNISFSNEDSIFCNGQITVRVNTTIPVKVNISAIFGFGASWLSEEFLTGSGTKISNPLVSEVINTRKSYNFGIDASQTSLINSSSITVEIRNNATNQVLDSYTFTRRHGVSPC